MSNGEEYRGDIPSSKVIVCDDDHDTRTIISHAVSALGHEVIEATGGQEAIDICTKELPHAIVMDIMMPEVTGHDFLRWLKEFEQDSFVPVLFLTALTELEDKVEGLEMGADDYLTKPFNYRELQARVTALLRIKLLTDKLIERRKEIERMQAELLKKERELVAMQLAGAAAHNLGQPITSILLNCKILESAAGGDEKQTKALQTIRTECDGMQQIVDKLKTIDASKTEDYIGDVSILSLKKDEK